MSVRPPRDRFPDDADLGAERLGPYVLTREIAAGELATVHLAQPIEGASPASTLVIKRLQRRHVRNPDYRAAMLREAELSSAIRSQDFTRTLAVEEAPEPYTVMERIEGANLGALLTQARNPDVDTTRFVVPLVVDALRALDYLHRVHDPAGFLVHQAPVPRHIMAGLDGKARLIDLTLAMGPNLPRSTLSEERLQPSEMAPEQALAPTQVDPRCDIFIVGVTLWEALTGKRLFAARTPQEALKKMLSSAIGAPSEAGALSQKTFDRVVARALVRPRAERFGSAAEMATELEEAALRAGLLADPQEIGAWVKSTLARGSVRPAPGQAPRSAGHSTIIGVGGPTPASVKPIKHLAEAPLHVEDGQVRPTRRPRPSAPPHTYATGEWNASSMSLPPNSPAGPSAFGLGGPPTLGMGTLGGSESSSGFRPSRPSPRPKRAEKGPTSFVFLCMVGVVCAGMVAVAVRTLSPTIGGASPLFGWRTAPQEPHVAPSGGAADPTTQVDAPSPEPTEEAPLELPAAPTEAPSAADTSAAAPQPEQAAPAEPEQAGAPEPRPPAEPPSAGKPVTGDRPGAAPAPSRGSHAARRARPRSASSEEESAKPAEAPSWMGSAPAQAASATPWSGTSDTPATTAPARVRQPESEPEGAPAPDAPSSPSDLPVNPY